MHHRVNASPVTFHFKTSIAEVTHTPAAPQPPSWRNRLGRRAEMVLKVIGTLVTVAKIIEWIRDNVFPLLSVATPKRNTSDPQGHPSI